MNKKPSKLVNNPAQADLRHDLKNKLAVIQGYSELLLTKLTNEKEQKWAKLILEESQKLREMIDQRIR